MIDFDKNLKCTSKFGFIICHLSKNYITVKDV